MQTVIPDNSFQNGARLILIGPTAAGKSTISKLLSKALDLPHILHDEKTWEYQNEIDLDIDYLKELFNKGNNEKLLEYHLPFLAYAAERLLEDHKYGIIDFGGGLPGISDEDTKNRLKKSFLPEDKIIQVLPHKDPKVSFEILSSRINERLQRSQEKSYVKAKDETEKLSKLRRWYIKKILHSSINWQFSAYTTYTMTNTPEQSCQEILNFIR